MSNNAINAMSHNGLLAAKESRADNGPYTEPGTIRLTPGNHQRVRHYAIDNGFKSCGAFVVSLGLCRDYYDLAVNRIKSGQPASLPADQYRTIFDHIDNKKGEPRAWLEIHSGPRRSGEAYVDLHTTFPVERCSRIVRAIGKDHTAEAKREAFMWGMILNIPVEDWTR